MYYLRLAPLDGQSDGQSELQKQIVVAKTAPYKRFKGVPALGGSVVPGYSICWI